MGTDWDLVRDQYLAGVRPSDLARDHGIKPDTIFKRIKRHSWGPQRAEVVQFVSSESPNRIGAVLVEETERCTREHIRISSRHLAQCAQVQDLIAAGQYEQAQAVAGILKNLFGAVKLGVDVHRLALNIAPPSAATDTAQQDGKGVTVVPADAPDGWAQECAQGGSP